MIVDRSGVNGECSTVLTVNTQESLADNNRCNEVTGNAITVGES